MKIALIISLASVVVFFHISEAQNLSTSNMVHVKGGRFTPLYGNDTIKVDVKDFQIDVYPVTNEQFRLFLQQKPEWNKEQVKSLFADENYLKHWKQANWNDANFKNSPVVNVSWFAAKAYCECQGKRLPEVAEWEFAALASETKPNASNDSGFYQRSLDWYSKPNPKLLPPVTTGFKNYYGIHGMIGLVWEWTSDFNSSLLTGESRANAGLDREMFCGAGGNNATDVKNYVAFMGYAFRSSLKARYTVSNLGFRCAENPDKSTNKKQ